MQRRAVIRSKKVAGAAMVAALALGATAISGPAATAAGNTGGRQHSTLDASSNLTIDVEANTLGGPISGGFNPFITSEDSYGLGAVSMIYEPLLQFNILKPGVVHPWLASAYKWSSGGKTLTFTIRNGVKWSDGSAFTGADVAYTFNLIKANAALNTNGVTFSSVSAPTSDTVVMNFASPAYTQLYAIAGQTLIVPQHIWSAISTPATYPDTTPVGTGPYTVSQVNSQSITMTKNASYWQPGKPAVTTLVFPDYESNTSAASALESGQLTWGGNFISHIQQIFANTADHVFYSPPNNTVALWPNLKTWPTDDLAVRKAISLALDRSQVAEEGEEGDEAPATSDTGLILPNDTSYLTSSTNTLPHNTALAKATLVKAGFTLKGGAWTSRTGRKVAITLEDPAAYSDYMASDQAIAQQLNSFGIKTKVSGVATSSWSSDLASGHFQMTLRYGQTAATPYGQYQNWLDPTLIGGAAGNFERFNDPAATAALKTYATAANTSVDDAAVKTLGRIVAAQLPIIPVMYGAAWGEYNSSQVTGFPTASNPYDPAQPSVPSTEYVVLQLKPKG
jgi:peptide/nickel transport system substrate-binding protein